MSPTGPTLGRMAAVSLALHLVIVLLAAGTAIFKGRRFINPNPYFVDLVAAPARKATVARRKTVTKEQAPPKISAPPEKKDEPKPEPKPNKRAPAKEPPPELGMKPVSKRPPDAPETATREIERLKAVERLRRLRSLRAVIDARRDDAGTEQAPPISGAAENGDRAHVYYGVVTHRVWEHWTYAGTPQPEWETLVYIRLDKSGVLLDQKVEESSGNEEFDRSVLRALSKAAPFPPPPEEIDKNIVFRFRP